MASQRLRRILPEDQVRRLTAAGIQTAGDLMNSGIFELMDRLDASGPEVEELLDRVARKCIPRPSTAWDLYQSQLVQRDPLSLEGPVTVESLKYPSLCIGSGLTELVGAAGVGKTQACHMLASMVAHRGSSVVYIDTEATFSPSRLVEMAQALFPGHYETSSRVSEFASRVLVYKESQSEKLLKILKSLEDVVVERDVQLVIVDSIAAPVRSEYDRKHIPQRQEFLSHCANALKLLSGNFNIPCLVTNQMMTRFNPKASESFLAAALGITWAHSVNTRFLLSVLPSPGQSLESSGSAEDLSEDQSVDLDSPTTGKEARRQITVSKSALFPSHVFEYEVWSGGLRVF